MAAKRSKQIVALPRQPLTKKRRSAIKAYTRIRADRFVEGVSIDEVVNYVLKAERMKADDLYDWLSKNGYTYNTRYAYWRLKQR